MPAQHGSSLPGLAFRRVESEKTNLPVDLSGDIWIVFLDGRCNDDGGISDKVRKKEINNERGKIRSGRKKTRRNRESKTGKYLLIHDGVERKSQWRQ